MGYQGLDVGDMGAAAPPVGLGTHAASATSPSAVDIANAPKPDVLTHSTTLTTHTVWDGSLATPVCCGDVLLLPRTSAPPLPLFLLL